MVIIKLLLAAIIEFFIYDFYITDHHKKIQHLVGYMVWTTHRL